MKLESFKFQDGKVLWLPGYPNKDLPLYQFLDLEAQSLASAIEVAPEDVNDFKLLWERTYRGVPMSGEVYSAECEMEIVTENDCFHGECSCDADDLNGQDDNHDECTHQSQVARLKYNNAIPAANSHDMKKEELWDFSSTQEAKDFLRYYFKRYHAMKNEAIEILIFEEVEGFRKSLTQTTK